MAQRTWKKIGPSSRPAHLLRLVHPAVYQKIGSRFGDRGANPQSGTVPLRVINHPVALTGEISIQRVQRGPQLSRRRDGLSPSLLTPKMTHHRADPIDADLGVRRFAIPQPPVQPFALRDDHCFRRRPFRIIDRPGPAGDLLQVLESHGNVEPVEHRRPGDAGIGENAPDPRLAIPSGFAGRNLGQVSPGATVGEGCQRCVLSAPDRVEAPADQHFDVRGILRGAEVLELDV